MELYNSSFAHTSLDIKQLSSFVAATSPDRLPAAGSRTLISADNKRCTKEIVDKPQPPIKHGQLRYVRKRPKLFAFESDCLS